MTDFMGVKTGANAPVFCFVRKKARLPVSGKRKDRIVGIKI